MKTFFFLVSLFFTGLANASYTVATDSGYCPSLIVSNLACNSILAVANTCLVAAGAPFTMASCSSNPVVTGGTMTRNIGANWIIGTITGGIACTESQTRDTLTDTCTTNTPTCSTGQHLDTNTNTCVDDVPTVTCIPAPRTIAPCPSGYAPSSMTVNGSATSNQYENALDSMPTQELLYAIGIAFSGLLGIGIGVRLL